MSTAKKSVVALGLCMLVSAGAVHAQGSAQVSIPRVDASIRLDGIANEAVWEQAVRFPMIQRIPSFGAEPTERTEVMVMHDGQYLYVAGKMFDRDPAAIRATSLERDGMNPGSDAFGIVLDSYLTKETASAFFVTPTGARSDFAVVNDAVPGRREPMETSWNAVWDASVNQTEEGWFAELRIPFSSLRFQVDKDGNTVMGLLVLRNLARKNEIISFPAVPEEWGLWGSFKPSEAQEVVLAGAKTGKPVYVTPYTMGGASRVMLKQNEAYVENLTTAREVGVDVKYGITDNLTLDLTYNTDFAQVESDDEQINLTRYSLFVPEKRLFFIERGSMFQFTSGGKDELFYTRRIGLNQGGQVPIIGGGRIVGRIGNLDVGVLNMQTAGVGTSPSENFGVARVRKQVLNPNSYVGAIFTSRMGEDGSKSFAMGTDASVRVKNGDYVKLYMAGSMDTLGLSTETMMMGGTWERRTQKGLAYRFFHSYIGEEYNPSVGFVPRNAHTRSGAKAIYSIIGGKDAWYQNHSVSVNSTWAHSLITDDFDGGNVRFSYDAVAKSGHNLGVSANLQRDVLPFNFRIARDVVVPAGDYSYTDFKAFWRSPQSRNFQLVANASHGSFYDGTKTSIGLMPTWNSNMHFKVSGGYLYNHVDFAARGQEFISHIGRLQAHAALNTQLTASTLVQYNSVTKAVGINARLRYNPREGRDLYLVWNEGLNTELDRLNPTLPRSGARTLVLKYSHMLSHSLGW